MIGKFYKKININIKPNVVKEKIALYFFGGMAEVYQLDQWMKVLVQLHKKEPIRIIVRSKAVFEYLITKKLIIQHNIPIVYIDTIDELLSYYEDNDFKVILYVNNGMKNFQSLIYHRALHIHLNHGESEKSSMYSNQSKCYDYTYVVGDAALDRYKRHMINIGEANYVKIGRPQLDHIDKIDKLVDKKIILYAPTDESTHISMRYTSIEEHGLNIVSTILSNKDYFLVYRPHPSTGSNSKKVKEINNKIIKMINNADNAVVEKDLDALDLLSIVDMAIFDNSSLIIDFLHFNKPMFATDMFLPEYHDISSFKMLDACIMINKDNIEQLNDMIAYEFKNDSWKEKREAIRSYYLGDYAPGESTNIFIEKVLEAMDERDELLREKGMLDTIH